MSSVYITEWKPKFTKVLVKIANRFYLSYIWVAFIATFAELCTCRAFIRNPIRSQRRKFHPLLVIFSPLLSIRLFLLAAAWRVLNLRILDQVSFALQFFIKLPHSTFFQHILIRNVFQESFNCSCFSLLGVQLSGCTGSHFILRGVSRHFLGWC